MRKNEKRGEGDLALCSSVYLDRYLANNDFKSLPYDIFSQLTSLKTL